MAESVLCLRWKDHTSEIASIYTSLLENNFLVDCTISAGGHSLKAHKLVLCACSPYFHRLFQEETGKHTFVILLDASFEILTAVIEFMYRGETQISNVDLKAFLTLAQSLQIKGLNDNSKDNANRNVSSATFRNVPEGPSEGNQATSEIPGVRTNQEVSAENISQTLPPHSDDYQNPARTNSSLPFEGLSSSQEEAWSSQEYQQPVGGNGVPTTMDVIVKRESLYAVISDTRNETWDRSNSDQQVSRNFASEVPQGSSSVFGERNLNQYSNSLDSRVGNVESSQVLPPQQQRMQIGNEESSDPKFDQEECLPHAVFVPVNEESEEPMDVRDVPEDDTNECVEVTEPACDRSSFLQPSSDDVILLDDDDDVQPIPEQQQDNQLAQPEPQQHQDRRAQKRQRPDDNLDLPLENPQASVNLVAYRQPLSRDKPFACDLCDMAFNERKSLANHRNTHTGERPYACEFCSKAFVQKQDLTSHRRTHTGERPYRCDVCGEAFARSDTLRTHKRKHTGERPYRCDDCGTGFHRPSSLAQHKNTHAGKMPYRCVQCGMTFSNERGLAYHKQKHADGAIPQ